jgi:hypothetical protein
VDEHNADATLLRPAVDPAIPRAARYLLLTHDPRAKTLGLLPLEPERRLATINGAATGLTTGFLVAVMGAAPWAVGVLIFDGAVAWQSATGRWALLLMEAIVAVTAVVAGAQIARFGEVRTRRAVNRARSRYRGRYLTAADFDAPARVLLRRAQAAIDAVATAEVSKAGLLEEWRGLAAQEWDIAVSLREQSRLRAKRAEITGTPAATDAAGTTADATRAAETRRTITLVPAASPATAELLRQQADAARQAEQSITSRIEALEQYAREVGSTDAAYRDWRARAQLAELTAPHLDMLARTAADAHGIMELTEMTDRARAIREALNDDDPPAEAAEDTGTADTGE